MTDQPSPDSESGAPRTPRPHTPTRAERAAGLIEAAPVAEALKGVVAGDWLEVRVTDGTWHPLRAISAPTMGRDFMVVWVCNPSDWDEYGPEAEAVPWPLSMKGEPQVRLSESSRV